MIEANPDWKWVYLITDKELPFPNIRIRLKRIKSFNMCIYIQWDNEEWTLDMNSKSKIQKWVLNRLNIPHTSYKILTLEDDELKSFLDDLDDMMELLYGK